MQYQHHRVLYEFGDSTPQRLISPVQLIS